MPAIFIKRIWLLIVAVFLEAKGAFPESAVVQMHEADILDSQVSPALPSLFLFLQEDRQGNGRAERVAILYPLFKANIGQTARDPILANVSRQILAMTNSIPPRQKAIVGREEGGLKLVDDAEVPQVEEDMVLVKNAAVAVNPVDNKMAAPHLVTAGAIAGHDFAGTVVAFGSSIWTAAPIKIGDRVCGAVQGLHKVNPNVGGYAEYVGATDIVLMKIPNEMSFEEAASLGTGIGTMGLALFHNLGVPGYPTKPATDAKMVLVYGGSTASGTMALQLLKTSGLTPITTCSPANFDLVKSYGAAHCFDYRSKDCIEQIKKYTKNSLKYVIDCVSEPETMEFCYQCVGRTGGKLTTLEPSPKYLNSRARVVKLDWVLGPALHGKRIAWPPPMERQPNPELAEFARKWFTTVQELLDNGRVKPHPLKIMQGGLEGVMDGLELLKNKQVSGQKLIYPLA